MGKILKSFLFLLFVISHGHLYSIEKGTGVFEVSSLSNSFVGLDHAFSGILKKLSNGRIIHLFRLDPGMNGSHVGNNGCLAKRFSDDNGLTWTVPEIIYKDEYDDRICSGGVLDNGEIIVFFGRYSSTQIWSGHYIDINYVSSKDYGITWSRSSYICNADLLGGIFDIFKLPGQKGYFAASYGAYYVDIRYSETGHNWDSIYCKWDFRNSRELNITEPFFIPIGKNKIIGLFRVEQQAIHQTISSDNGKTWSKLEPTNLANGYFCVFPHCMFDSVTNRLFTIVCDRRSSTYDMDNLNSGIWTYCENADSIFKNPQGYKNYIFKKRPNPNIYRLLGYPYSVKTNDSTYLAIMCDNTIRPNALENADIYQFYIHVSTGKKYNQKLSFQGKPEFIFSDSLFLSAQSSASLPVTYTSNDTSIAKIKNGYVVPVTVGACTISAFQKGDIYFNASDTVSIPIKISKGNQVILFDSIPSLTQIDTTIHLSAKSNSNVQLCFKSSDTTVALIKDNSVRIIKYGLCSITATQKENQLFNEAIPVKRTLNVIKTLTNVNYDPITVFPNPSQGIIHINIDENVLLKLYDVTGKMVFYSNSNSNSLDIKGLISGIYRLIVIKNNRIIANQNIVVSN